MIDRRAFYDQRAAFRVRETGRCYQQLLRKQYAFWVPPGIAGAGGRLRPGRFAGGGQAGPRRGRGLQPGNDRPGAKRHPELEFQVADAAEYAAAEQFDYILLADLVNDLPDVQAVFERLQSAATRARGWS